jgi:hypothetical protein
MKQERESLFLYFWTLLMSERILPAGAQVLSLKILSDCFRDLKVLLEFLLKEFPVETIFCPLDLSATLFAEFTLGMLALATELLVSPPKRGGACCLHLI